jgi:hypothetical protein
MQFACLWEDVMKFAGLVFAAAIVAACGAQAENMRGVFVSGEDLNTSCQAFLWRLHNPNTNATSVVVSDAEDCLSFVRGVFDAATIIDAPKYQLCTPEHTTTRTITELVAKFLDEHPEARQYTAASVVITRLQTAYPCK